MNISKEEIKKEKKYLDNCINVIKDYLSELGQELYEKEEKSQEFKKYIWDNKASLDPTELKSLMSDNDLEVYLMMQKGKYFQRLFKIQNSPYFGSIIFEEENEPSKNIYLGITHLEDKNKNYLIYDWRAPISSLFYDYEVGECSYKAPEKIIKGNLKRKRQYKIEDGKIKHIFDNSINIDDSLLQEVLSNDGSEKMKNIVNTIQQEQNKIIRNVEDKSLIVQGIAGSGKTSVALHRIAFLLYKIENLSSKNVLIFSPNNVFSEYISNVLPELGEDNPSETTYANFLESCIKEYKAIETFTEFIARYYTYKEKNIDLVKYKQSDKIIKDIEDYVLYLIKNIKFTKNIEIDIFNEVTKEQLKELFERYDRFPLFTRITEISKKLSENYARGKLTLARSINKKILESMNIEKNYKKIYYNFYKSKFCKIKLSDNEIRKFVNKNKINYEDAIIFSYIKGLLEGFNYNNMIKEIVVDEAQDYTLLQYKILTKIFKKSSFSILGDVNQTINPYYKYESLEQIKEVLDKTKYLELTKTYRSSKEIIEYTNKILNLTFVSAIRKDNNKPVLFRKETNLKKQLLNDINYLKKEYKSVAIITKDDEEANEIYNLLKDDINIGKITINEEIFRKDLIVVPSYMAKGLEFDSVIVYNKINNIYKENEKYLYYVACSRAQHELIIYN